MREILASEGYQQAASADDADIVLLNTCSIREKAEAKIYSRLGVLRKRKRLSPETPELAKPGLLDKVHLASCF